MEMFEINADGSQHNCTVKKVDEKGKEQICNGHLREWLTAPADVNAKVPAGQALYRCRRCGAVYHGSARRHLRAGKVSNDTRQPQANLPTQFPVVR
jgi:hypothetical protein